MNLAIFPAEWSPNNYLFSFSALVSEELSLDFFSFARRTVLPSKATYPHGGYSAHARAGHIGFTCHTRSSTLRTTFELTLQLNPCSWDLYL